MEYNDCRDDLALPVVKFSLVMCFFSCFSTVCLFLCKCLAVPLVVKNL